jgi:hypothetical protein
MGADFLQREDTNFQNIDWTQLDNLLAQLQQVDDIYGTNELYRIQ